MDTRKNAPKTPLNTRKNATVNKFIVPRQPPAARPAMRTGTGIFLITTGAVLLFALRAGSVHWLNLPIVGVIFILAGGFGLLLPRLAHARSRPDRLRRWVQPYAPNGTPPAADPGGNGNQPPQAQETSAPTMVDDLLQFEHPLL
jgi:hypothetical protein